MAKAIGGSLTVVLCLFFAVPALAQDGSINAQQSWKELWSTDMSAPQGAAQKPGHFSLGLRVETTRLVTELDAATDNGVDVLPSITSSEIIVEHSVGFIWAQYTYALSPTGTIEGHLGVGMESIAFTNDITDVTPDTSTDTEAFDSGVAFQIGASYTHDMGTWTLGGGIDFRSGSVDFDYTETATFSGADTSEFDYALFRISVKAGYKAAPGVVPYLSLRFTSYKGEYTDDSSASSGAPDVFEADLELDSVVGLSLGVDLSSGPLSGGAELMFLDAETVGFGAGISYGF
jgi:hypothetical protein